MLFDIFKNYRGKQKKKKSKKLFTFSGITLLFSILTATYLPFFEQIEEHQLVFLIKSPSRLVAYNDGTKTVISQKSNKKNKEVLNCPNNFNENGELLNSEAKNRTKLIVEKIEKNLSDIFINGEINFLTRDQLSKILEPCEVKLMNDLFDLNPEKYDIFFPQFSDCHNEINRNNFVFLPKELTAQSTKNRIIIPPAVPKKIAPQIEEMLEKMQSQIDRKLLVESGYRSPYFQAFLFLKYLQKFGTATETAKLVALPCYSEHGTQIRPAIDLITEDGISDQNVNIFVSRKEYTWMKENSREFNFFMTFPQGNRFGYQFEPWHFHYENSPNKISDIPTPLGMKRITANTEWGKFIENLALYPPGTRTKMLFRRENRPDGSEFIKVYKNYIYENYIRTFAVVDIPVSTQQDCSKHLVRLISLFYKQQNHKNNLQFPLSNNSILKFNPCPTCDFETWLNETMMQVGTQTWRHVLERVKDEKDVQIGDILIEPQTTHATDPIYDGSAIGHTAVVVGISEDEHTGERYYLIASGSLPVTNLRIARASNHWQGQSGWLSMTGYLRRSHRYSVEFYRITNVLDKFVE